MSEWLAKVRVTLKPTVNDPPGLAVRDGLRSLGFEIVEQVRVGKYLEVRLQAEDEGQAAALVGDMCHKLLSNPVIEVFAFDLERAD
jgi:phosphoribosylformylglycinamidine synthase